MARPPKKLVSSPGEPQTQVGTQLNPAMTASAMARRSGGVNQAAAGRSTGLGLDSEGVRRSMVERLRASGPLDAKVLDAVAAVPRHLFVDAALVTQAYEDTSLPIGHGQTISKPSVVTRMIGVLMDGVTARAGGHLGKVLEVGTGCGYQAAVLCQLSRHVVSVERIKGLHDKARDLVAPLRMDHLRLVYGDGMLGHPPNAPYDSIIAAACGSDVPEAWLEQLAVGGRLISPVLDAANKQRLVVIDRLEAGGFQRTEYEAVQFVPLKSGSI
ncbi:MAG: protein-L-isoaspartate O-methyltransferase [Burkholderiales bacterium 28-67-8]|nr:MAG: protein-L-isoaspartate O-methyltransferase [Burkholderiales bacterium 28-67-8]